jgi:L-ascorbate metabolism protein UlaG (beta-lactamase superfamily)
MPFRFIAAAIALLLGSAGLSHAQGCFPIAAASPNVFLAAERAAIPADATVQLTFLGHSSFLIETKGGVSVVTDYNGSIRAPFTPDIVTMNNAHSTHYTHFVEPGVKHVLRGWNPEGGEAHHDLRLEDLRVRNVPTSVHGRYGLQGNSNAIFVFEVEDLCIAHLGHLHHLLERQHLGELGQIDIVLVPVDGVYTMSQEEMVEVVKSLGAPLVIPMHYFGSSTLASFVALIEDDYEIVMAENPTVALSRLTLPRRRVLVLPGF